MAEKDGFKDKPNCGVPRADLDRGFSKCGTEEHGDMIGYSDDALIDFNAPFFNGGFAGRPGGWER